MKQLRQFFIVICCILTIALTFKYAYKYFDYCTKTNQININTATVEQLMSIPNVGQATAKRIVTYRLQHKFNSIEELENIKGIKEKRFDAIKPYIFVGDD